MYVKSQEGMLPTLGLKTTDIPSEDNSTVFLYPAITLTVDLSNLPLGSRKSHGENAE